MRTSALLTVVALVTLAGCAGSVVDPGTPAASPTSTDRPATATPTATAAPTPTPYPNTSAAFPAGPKSEPARPDELTAETAAAFAKTYEFRYSYNEFWRGPGTEVGMSNESCLVESTEAVSDGYEVVLQCSAYVNRPPGDGETTTTVHADYPPWTVRYYVDENSLVREEIDR